MEPTDNSPGLLQWRSLLFLFLAFLLAVAFALPFATTNYDLKQYYYFDVDLTADHGGVTQVFYDIGNGIVEGDSTTQPLQITHAATRYRYLLHGGEVKRLRFDFNNHEGHYTFKDAVVRSLDGDVVYRFLPTDFHPDHEIKSLRVAGEKVEVETISPSSDPYIYLKPAQPIKLPFGKKQARATVRIAWRNMFCALVTIGLLLEFGRRFFGASIVVLMAALRRHPLITIALTSAFSVVVQVHPVIFSGKSFASPNSPTFLLYDHFPTLPGYESANIEDQKGADMAAFMYSHVDFPGLERKALFADHELPLWNRYNLSGVPLLGQGQTMFGEVLNTIPLLAGNSAGSWDVKFILSRWIFAFSLGAFVWMAMGRLKVGAFIALTASWIGYFSFRATHPAQFAVDFGPMVLLAWGCLDRAKTQRGMLGAAGFLFLANWEMMTSGTIKEAYITLLCVDFAGLLYLCFRARSFAIAKAKIIAASLAGVALIAISAPLWWTFLDTLKVSRTSYDVPAVHQIPRWQTIGFFEDLFYRRFVPQELHVNPSCNLIVLLGTSWLLAALIYRRKPGSLAIILGAAVSFSTAFSIVPADWLLRMPFLGNIHHVGNTFGCSLIILLTITAGLGIADFLEAEAKDTSQRRFVVLLTAIAIVAFLYIVYMNVGGNVTGSPFYRGYIPALAVGTFVLIFAVHVRRVLSPAMYITILGGALVILLWRHGQYNQIRFDAYVFNPQVRTDIHAPSPALAKIKQLANEPVRTTGFNNTFFPGVGSMYFMESIYGVDAIRNKFYDELLSAAGLRKILHWGELDSGGERDLSRGAMDMLNVRFYLDNPGDLEPTVGLQTVAKDDLRVDTSPTVWPRAFFTNRIVDEEDLPQLISKLKKSQGQPFAALAADEMEAATNQSLLPATGDPVFSTPARDYHLTSNATSFTVDAAGPGIVVLTEAYYPDDFRAYVNGAPASYLRVNHAFKGIFIRNSGTYDIRFEYWPHHLTTALSISAAGIVFGIGMFVTLYRKTLSLLPEPE